MSDQQQQPIIVKKVKGGGHGHHGGSWKVAYADFVTAMMAFFMVMWIMGLSDETRNEIQGYFNDPMAFMKKTPTSRTIVKLPNMAPPGSGQSGTDRSGAIKADANELDKIKQEIMEELEKEINPDLKKLLKNVDITVTTEGLLIEFLDDNAEAFFELGSAKVRNVAKKIFAKVGQVIAKHKRYLRIDGHTDARPYPSNHYDNWDLSADRAVALKKIMMKAGVSYKQIRAVHALADTKLRNPEDPNHFSNRRVSVLLPFKIRSGARKNLPGDELGVSTQAIFRYQPTIRPNVFPLSNPN